MLFIPGPGEVAKVTLIVSVRLFVALFKITGYICMATWQATWFAAHGRSDMIGDTIGRFGEAVVNALADIFTFK
jgi:hypothetical protein